MLKLQHCYHNYRDLICSTEDAQLEIECPLFNVKINNYMFILKIDDKTMKAPD